MPGTGERAYVYAKACGITGKSFIGKGLAGLSALTRLSELDRLIFGTDARDLPERELLPDLERRIINRTAKQIITIVDSFRKPPELLVRMVPDFEYEDVRDLRTLSGGSTAPIQNKLDRHYYTGLWDSLFKLAPSDRSSIERILAEELSLRNAAWALRMRTYYGMTAEQTREYLVYIPAPKGHASLADDALASLTLALDSPADWTRWRFVRFLNRPVAGEHWTVNPRHFQNAAAQYLHRLARHSFRRRPFSLDTAACFIKLKLFEADLLTSVAEGLSLGMGAEETLAVLGAAP